MMEFETTKLTLKTRRKQLKVSNDGEIETLQTPLAYRSRPQALKVLRPVSHER